jgi:translation initiation factor IF-1
MAKEELLILDEVIEELVADGRCGGRLANDHRPIAYRAGRMRKYRIKSLGGDRVRVEMTPYDRTEGRIVFREQRAGGPSGRGGKRRW